MVSLLGIFQCCIDLFYMMKSLCQIKYGSYFELFIYKYEIYIYEIYICLFIYFCNVCSKFNTLPTDHGFNQLQVYFAWQLIEIAIGIYNQFSDKTKGNTLKMNIISFHLFNTYIIICNSSEKDLSSLNEEIILWFQPQLIVRVFEAKRNLNTNYNF